MTPMLIANALMGGATGGLIWLLTEGRPPLVRGVILIVGLALVGGWGCLCYLAGIRGIRNELHRT